MSDSPATISVIIPTYNRSSVLGRAIASVLDQEHQAHQVIVVDDGSQEDLGPCLAPFDGRIQVIRQDNAGAAAARNTGIENASGTWLCFLDSDDYWLPGRLSRLSSDLTNAGPDVVAHIGDVTFEGPGYRKSLFDLKGLSIPKGPAHEFQDRLGLVISGMSLGGAAIRRAAFDAVGGFDPGMRMLEDTDLFCRLAFEGHFLVTGDAMVVGERLEGDAAALTRLEHDDPVAAAQMHVRYLDKLRSMSMSPEERRLVHAKLSGALYLLAEAQAEVDPAISRETLMMAARVHPVPLKGWAKSALARFFGFKLTKRLSGRAVALDRG